MSFFTNPFNNNSPAAFPPSSLSPQPISPALRRSSLVRAAAAPSTEPTTPASHAHAHAHAGPSSSGPSFVSPFTNKNRPQSPSRPSINSRRGSTISGSAEAGPAIASPAVQRRASVGVAPVASSPTVGPPSPATSVRSPHMITPTAAVFGPGMDASSPIADSVQQFSAPGTTHFLSQPQHHIDHRRKSVDVGVLGLGTHRLGGLGSASRRVREAVGPDAGDKEAGLIGEDGSKDRMLGRHLASLLAHSLSLCADPAKGPSDEQEHLATIPGSPQISPAASRNTSLSAESLNFSALGDSQDDNSPPYNSQMAPGPPPMPAAPVGPVFPVLSEAKRFKLIGNLQSWTFNAMSYNSDELLSCVGIIFESVRNMEGVQFDMDKFKALLLSLRSAYHARNGYHNFSHATDVTQACYSFLVRMGLAPPLYLLCEDDYDPNLGEGRRKWRRNRAVEEGGMGELLRPMDVFALMVAAIGHDVGHPGLSNAYMVNARTPVAQVYDDKSVLENFHTVTLIHMLRRHQFDYLLGGDFGHLGDQATSFRKVLEASILATDMSRHFAFVNQINEMGRRFGERHGGRNAQTIEADRLLLCSGLMKCADISNPTRPHRISRAWSTALLAEWGVQAAIEAQFNLPVSVMTLDPADTKAQARSQVGFIDLFAKPLFNAMAGVVDEFADFAEKLRDGRIAWEAISLQTDEDFAKPVAAKEWKLTSAPSGRPLSGSTIGDSETQQDPLDDASATPDTPTPGKSAETVPSPVAEVKTAAVPIPLPMPKTTAVRSPPPSSSPRRNAPPPLKAAAFNHTNRHLHNRFPSGDSNSSANASPLSPSFPGSASSAGFSLGSGSTPATDNLSLFSSPRYQIADPFASLPISSTPSSYSKQSCNGQCTTATAMCGACSRKQASLRRGSLGDALTSQAKEEARRAIELDEEDPDVWPPYPFQPAAVA